MNVVLRLRSGGRTLSHVQSSMPPVIGYVGQVCFDDVQPCEERGNLTNQVQVGKHVRTRYTQTLVLLVRERSANTRSAATACRACLSSTYVLLIASQQRTIMEYVTGCTCTMPRFSGFRRSATIL